MAKDNVVEFERLVLMHFHGSPLKKSTFVGVVVTSALSLALAACGGSSTNTAAGGCTPGSNTTLPKLSSVKTVGFSQNALDGAWRNAESDSMAKAVAAKGWNPVIQTNANNSDSQQVQDINTLINDKVDVLVIAPHTEDAEVQAIIKARQACIPVFLVDRDVNHSTASVGRDYVTFLGSDFMKQGATAADQMIDALGGPSTTANIIELKGTTGASPAILRGAGFETELATKAPGIKIVAAQTADFDRAKGQALTSTLLTQFPDIKGVYAHNDEMGIGAEAALVAAGKAPGTDVKIVSIDGTKDATQLVIDGKYNAVVESNPHFGTITVQAISDYMSGNSVANWIVVQDRVFLKADGTAAAYLTNGAF